MNEQIRYYAYQLLFLLCKENWTKMKSSFQANKHSRRWYFDMLNILTRTGRAFYLNACLFGNIYSNLVYVKFPFDAFHFVQMMHFLLVQWHLSNECIHFCKYFSQECRIICCVALCAVEHFDHPQLFTVNFSICFYKVVSMPRDLA